MSGGVSDKLRDVVETDVILADEDNNSISTDDVNRVIIDASGAPWWPNLELIKVAPVFNLKTIFD